MNIKLLILILLLLSATNLFAYEQIDNFCLRICTENNGSYSYCSKKCTYDPNKSTGSFKIGYDMNCFKECVNDGQPASECRRMCEQ
jgi:hypothetical protein